MKKLFLSFVILTTTACGQTTDQTGIPVNSSPAVASGEVLETMNVESYTYVKLADGEQEIWLATSPVQVNEGDRVRFSGGMLMADFHSTTLDRTFDQILFVGSVEVLGPDARPNAEQVKSPANIADPHAGLDLSASVLQSPTALELLEDGVTIAEILADPGSFAGQQVVLRAKVMKVNANIMGKNWLTLQDGSGAAPDSQLTAASRQSAAVGDVLTLTGLVQTDVDLGHGYAYKVLLENAEFE